MGDFWGPLSVGRKLMACCPPLAVAGCGRPCTLRGSIKTAHVSELTGVAARRMASPGGVFVRRAEFDDQLSIQALIGEEAHIMAKRFGAFDISNMIENASLGITAVDEKGQVVGYVTGACRSFGRH